MNRNRTLRILALGFLLGLAAISLSCNATVGVGVSAPIGGGWGAGQVGSVGVTVPIGR
jgi:hypothetical protein